MMARVFFLPLLLSIGVAGCAVFGSSGTSSSVHIDRMYFGRAIGDSATVSDSSWNAFLSEEISPSFPDGFTFWKGEGQWKNRVGTIVHERSFIVEIVHPVPDKGADRAIERILAEYKRRFHQEAVLHVSTTGEASF
jgi:hypothetical protein